MSLKLISLAGFLILLHFICIDADVYMHGPRGSNNRNNEKSANRRTGNRVFDSQNNNRGGYNKGDRYDGPAGNDESKQYHMEYFMSSRLLNSGQGISTLAIEWTNQHGCGGDEDSNPNKLNCNMVFQYMCEPDADVSGASDIVKKSQMRDGTTTNRQNYRNAPNGETKAQFESRKRNTLQLNRAYNEPIEWYDKCTTRQRNKGLFIADQKVRGNEAKNTRQNPNGNRNGLECPEERDYFPYWHPTDWRDIGILAENATMCTKLYEAFSYNTVSKWECVEKWRSSTEDRHYSKHNNKAACEEGGGVWTEFHNYLEKAPQFTTPDTCTGASNAEVTYIWGRPIYGTAAECLVALKAPWCKASMFSRVNHLGNGADLEPLTVNWQIPYFPSGDEQRCVLRIRYNISTDDYDPHHTDSKFNNGNGVKSPVTQNPTVDIGANNVGLKLAINTAQFGRTFQDRSHVFKLKPRTTGAGEIGETANLYNVNVRGKRGNIVQTFPAVEYDFFPTNLQVSQNDLVHFQWTGSNTHNNGNPAGDGQAGDDGEGRGGTDRSNILGMNARGQNFPLPMENSNSIFNNVKAVKYQAVGQHMKGTLDTQKKLDIAVQFATAGYTHCVKSSTCQSNSVESKNAMQNQLNNAPASFGGMVLQFNPGTYNYTCTRNNNFSNRSQKGSLIVSN